MAKAITEVITPENIYAMGDAVQAPDVTAAARTDNHQAAVIGSPAVPRAPRKLQEPPANLIAASAGA